EDGEAARRSRRTIGIAPWAHVAGLCGRRPVAACSEHATLGEPSAAQRSEIVNPNGTPWEREHCDRVKDDMLRHETGIGPIPSASLINRYCLSVTSTGRVYGIAASAVFRRRR